MSLKPISNTNKIPYRIKDLLNRTNYLESFLPDEDIEATINFRSEEWYIFVSKCVEFTFNQGANPEVTDMLTAYIFNFFKERRLFYDWIFENIDSFEEDDLDYYYDYLRNKILQLFLANNYKYKGLYESTILDFNPLYNVDAYEEIDRKLDQDGTVNTKDTGTDTYKKTGNETNTKSGTDTDSHTGTDTMKHTGTDTNVESGTDTNAHTGTQGISEEYDSLKQSNGDGFDTGSVTTSNSSTFYDSDKTIKHAENSETTDDSKSSTTTFNDTNTETKNLTDQRTTNLEDKRTVSLQDRKTLNITDATTHNTTDTNTKNLNSLMTKDLTDTEKTIIRRFGNIGVTQSTQLLENYRNFVTFNFLNIVAKDVIETLSYSVY